MITPDAASPTIAPPAIEATFNLESLSGANNYNEWIYSRMQPYLGKKVLELGCGIGNLTEYFLRGERELLSIDIDPVLIAESVRRIGARPGLTVQNVAIQDLIPTLKNSFDSIVSSNVLEHIPEPIEAEVVRASFELLKPGGYSTHWVPAMPCLYGSLDRKFEHCRRYDKKRLIGLFEKAGFQIERCRYYNMVGFFGWWWQAKVRKTERIDTATAMTFDRWIVPVARRIEPMLWLPFGQSLWIAARKPG